MDYHSLLADIEHDIQPLLGTGVVANYIPVLARVPARQFGMAVVTMENELFAIGDSARSFSVQSISKLFLLSLVLAQDDEKLWLRMGHEASGTAFNSLVQLEFENGIPRNPFINAGALVLTDRYLQLRGDARGSLREFLREESGNQNIDFDADVATSELAYGHRNAALAHFMKSFGNIVNEVDEVLLHYCWQCSLAMTCADLAYACGFLMRHGLRRNGQPLLTRSQAKQINAIMLTCGTYDAAGDFAYRVGLPGKSGVGGGIVAVIPNKLSICVWSPGLDAHGNSVAGVAALDMFTTRTGLSVF